MEHYSELITAQREAYRKLFAEHGRSEEALCWSKNKQHIRFEALHRYLTREAATLLDYGCGLGDLMPWLAEHKPRFSYFGVDIVDEFVKSNRATYSSMQFQTIASPAEIEGRFDYCAMSGVFNMRTTDASSHRSLIEETMTAVFEKVDHALAIDFLSTDVDFQHPAGHHQEIGALTAFVSKHLSRRYNIDKTYLPFEYCITIFKDSAISKPRNVYANDVA
jgi:hypothetical protein